MQYFGQTTLTSPCRSCTHGKSCWREVIAHEIEISDPVDALIHGTRTAIAHSQLVKHDPEVLGDHPSQSTTQYVRIRESPVHSSVGNHCDAVICAIREGKLPVLAPQVDVFASDADHDGILVANRLPDLLG